MEQVFIKREHHQKSALGALVNDDLDQVKAFLVHLIGDVRENEHLVRQQFLFFGIRGILKNVSVVAKPIRNAFCGAKSSLVQGIDVFLDFFKGFLKVCLACHDLLLWKELFVLEKKVEVHYDVAKPDRVIDVIFLPVHRERKHQAKHNLLK